MPIKSLPPGILTLGTAGSGLLSTGLGAIAHAPQPTTITTAVLTGILTLAALAADMYREKLRHAEAMFAMTKAEADATFNVTDTIAILRGAQHSAVQDDIPPAAKSAPREDGGSGPATSPRPTTATFHPPPAH
jgi:hypothetical protein